MSEWTQHAAWWLEETADDPIYRSDVLPLLTGLVGDSDGVLLDLGCGEGQVMHHLPGRVIGCDVSPQLLDRAGAAGPVVRAILPDLSWLRSDSIDLAYAVLVLEHLADEDLFAAAARVVRGGGSFVLVMNHPAFTATGSGPIMDVSDGEFLWRWGSYFERGQSTMATSGASVTFYHRPLATILNAAATAGWSLDRMTEVGFSESAIATEPGYVGQEQMPRLLGVRWMNTQGGRHCCR